MRWHWISRLGGYLTRAEKAVAHAIAQRCNERGEAWPGMERLRRESGYSSERTVQKALRGLVRKGCLTVTHRPGTSNLYRLREPDPNALQIGLFQAPRPPLYPRKNCTPPPSTIAGVPRNPSGTKPKEKPTTEGKKYLPLVSLAEGLFRERFGQGPTWLAADWKQLQALVKARPDLPMPEMVVEFERRYWNLLESTDPFITQQGGSLKFFCANFDRFLAGPVHSEAELRRLEQSRHARAGGHAAAPHPQPIQQPDPPTADPEAREMWDQILSELQQTLNPQTFSTWFKGTRGVEIVFPPGTNGDSSSVGTLRVFAPNVISEKWLATEGVSCLNELRPPCYLEFFSTQTTVN